MGAWENEAASNLPIGWLPDPLSARDKTMTKLSVNLNKVALLRAARGRDLPNLVEAARLAIDAGCDGLTLHPRVGEPHATLEDVRSLARLEPVADGSVELNIEGDGREALLAVVGEVKATQFTLVPADPGERTTARGWGDEDDPLVVERVVTALKPTTRVSLFIEPLAEAVELAAAAGVDVVEFHTYRYASLYGGREADEELARICRAGEKARALGLRVHAGHDLNLENLVLLVGRLQPDEVSIGHALLSEALLTGLPLLTRRYREVIRRVSGHGGG